VGNLHRPRLDIGETMSGIIGVSPDMRSGVVGKYPTGHVIQTITAHSATEVNAAGNNYVTITNMSGAITPKKDNSKIIIHMDMGGKLKAENWLGVYVKVTGTATGIVKENTEYAYSTVNDSLWMPFPISILAVDTPASTSTQTYQLHVRTGADGTVADLRVNSTNAATDTNPATITLTEVAQ